MLNMFLTMLVVFVSLGAMHYVLIVRQPELGNEKKFPRQLALLAMTLVGILVIVFVLPISDSARNQLIGLIGLLVSGIIAISATGIVANLMAGILLRITKPFKSGDFIEVGQHFGRVSERGLFDTEIQTQSRELIALPNTLLVSQPVKTIRSSGTLVSAEVSIGYDIHHIDIERLLVQAAEKTELAEPFVHILELGNFTVSYRVSGLLLEVKKLLTVRSMLYRHILDVLHDAQIEIMSPSVMNQRKLEPEKKVIPAKRVVSEPAHSVAEEVAFDKAEAAEAAESAALAVQNQAVRDLANQQLSELEMLLENASLESDRVLRQKLLQIKQKLAASQLMTPDAAQPTVNRNAAEIALMPETKQQG